MANNEASDLIGPWLKDRYSHKHGVPNVKNMDKCMAALSDIELNALMTFCKTADAKFLDIPIYEVQLPVDEDSETVCENMENFSGSAPPLGSRSKSETKTISTKLAGISKRGMAQPRGNRG